MATKTIKFDLPIKGKSISTFEELRSNFGADLLPIFQSGRLHKWFLYRKLVEKADAVKAIDMQGSELEQLTGICKVLELEGDDVALALIPVYFESKHNIGYAFYCNNPAKTKPIYIVNNNIIEELKPIRANANANNSTLDKYVRVFIQPDEVLSEDGNTTNHIITAAVINDFSIESAVKTGYFFTNIKDAMSGKDMTGKSFVGEDFRNGKFVGTNFTKCDLTNANFSGADLTNTVFDKANLKNANFQNANMCNAKFRETKIFNTNFDKSILKDTIFSTINSNDNSVYDRDQPKENFPPSFNDADLSGTRFFNVRLVGSQFKKANLSNSNIEASIFENCQFNYAKINESSFKNIGLWMSDFEEGDLSFSIFSGIIYLTPGRLYFNCDVWVGKSDFEEGDLSFSIFSGIKYLTPGRLYFNRDVWVGKHEYGIESGNNSTTVLSVNFKNTKLTGVKGIDRAEIELATNNFLSIKTSEAKK